MFVTIVSKNREGYLIKRGSLFRTEEELNCDKFQNEGVDLKELTIYLKCQPCARNTK